ncbi:MAG: Translation elongation factor LepA [uncultured Campylobacterales bacterium]|uniref:Elongation factor 4 n=1 Tax=uncultured Campylobacterales bacterium TaxID=352960 RepID=A0A6S6SCS3_9BACT|nr:MAG: Translation elongation factor LepA [uncultured Campylobacterales bacterium]
MSNQKNIRNFSIIAHIDHGKSTLADRLISECGTVELRDMSNQLLDSMDIERERGITIKAQSVRLIYKRDDGEYILNLIDTPGHVDFSYEVSKSIKSSEGALLVVDSSQGVEAQTIANVYIAIENNLELIPILNKIDLPASNPQKVKDEIESTIGLDCEHAIEVSAKTGQGIKQVLDTIVDSVPAPSGNEDAPTKALIYDSWFDPYLGALALVRVYDGTISKKQQILIVSTGRKYEVLNLMYSHPLNPIKTPSIECGEVGIIVLGLKDTGELAVGDTITDAKNPTTDIVEGFEEAKSFVFAGVFPIETDKFEDLRNALEKLKLNDSSISYEPETSAALGFGFRVGFLGLLHMEVVKERLEREFNLDLIATAPTVVYEIVQTNDEVLYIENPSDLPPINKIAAINEPYVKATLLTPNEYLGNVMKLLNDKRGIQLNMEYITETRVMLEYEIPMNEIVMDFYDKLKSVTKGYASFDYEQVGYRKGDLVKLDIIVAGDIVDALSIIVPKNQANYKGREFVKKMKEIVPRQLFEVAIQASLGSKIIARESIRAMRKNVTAKCYGGDITRKRKLLEKQKAGKKRMKSIGKIDLPSEAFLTVLKID